MVKKQGESLKPYETKSYIIKYILENSGPVGEPDIRDYLKKEHELVDQGTINRHLHYLKNEGLITLIEKEKAGHRNKWDITKIEHLANIMKKIKDESLLKNINLNTHEKSLMIALQKNGYDIFSYAGILFYVQLLLSSSYFYACIDTNIELLWDRAQGIYAYKNHSAYQHIENLLVKCYTTYITRYPNLEISIESFISMMTQMSLAEISPTELSMMIQMPRIEEISLAEKYMKIWEEELLGLSEETSDEMHQGTMEDDRKIYWNMYCAAFDLRFYNFFSENTRFDLLFEHYLYQDILDGIASSEEIVFAIHTKANLEYDNDLTDNLDEYHAFFDQRYLSILEQVSRVLAKHKHPSIFGNIYSNPTDTLNGLIEILNKHQEIP